MTREELRRIAQEWNEKLVSRGAEPLKVPDPEPAYWDNLPHLVPIDWDNFTKSEYWAWRRLLEGEYKAITCAGCGQIAWEHDSVWQALVYLSGLEYYVDGFGCCLPCYKAVRELPDVIVDPGYEVYREWDFTDIVPSEGVFTEDYWCNKAGAKLNYSADELVGVLNGTLTHAEILEQRIKRRSEV